MDDVQLFMAEMVKFLIKTQPGWSVVSDPTHHGNGGDSIDDYFGVGGTLDREACERAIASGAPGLHENTRDLSASDARLGYSEREILEHTQGLMRQCRHLVDEKRWQERYSYLGELARSAVRKFGAEKPDDPDTRAPATLAWLDKTGWDLEPPAQEWAVLDRIPARQVCLLSGHGATGKSTVGLQLCAAHVLGLDWLKSLPEPGAAFFIDAEDDKLVIRRRLYAITKHYNKPMAELAELHILSLAGQDAVMATANRDGKIIVTALYKLILEAAADLKPRQIVIANLANVFAGNENDRSQVQQFVSLLTRVAITSEGAIVVISHPSLTGLTSGSGLSGSTQWHNAIRAHMWLRGVKATDEQPDNDLRVLQFMKNQYGKISEQLTLRWKAGLFLPESSSSLEKLAREAELEHVFMVLMNRFESMGRVSSPYRSPTYAPTQFAGEEEAKTIKATKTELESAMNRLLKNGQVRIKTWGPASRQRHCLVINRPVQ